MADSSPPADEQNMQSAGGYSTNPNDKMSELSQALANRKVEPICTSYLALLRDRRGASRQQVLADIQQARGATAIATIIAAFSHRACLMCDDGVARCGSCEGAGEVDGFSCPSCDGLTIQPCSFCQGAGWAGLDEIPAEFRKGALTHRVRRLDKAIHRLGKVPPTEKLIAMGMPAAKRSELLTWLVRLQARLRALAAVPIENWDEHAARYTTLATRVEDILEALRPKQEQVIDEEDDEGSMNAADQA